MAKLYNLARVSTATTGTGTIALGAAIPGCLTFALAGVSNGDVVSYGITDGANSETGTGTYSSSGPTLTRTVTKSTNSNAAINLSGTAQVFISARAEDLVSTSENNTLAGTVVINNSGVALQPFLNAEIFPLVLSGAMDGATQGETVLHFDTYGANSNGTLLFTKSGGGAQFTGSISGTVLTVTAMQAGSGPLAVGQIVMANGAPQVTIASFGTGAGGTGTYNLSANAGTVASTLILTNDSPVAPTGVKNGQGLGFIISSGWYGGVGTRTTQTASIQFNSEGDWTASSWPTGINILTTPPGGTALVERANIASSGALNWFQNGIGSTLTDGIALKNNTAAAAGAQQQSPSLHLAGQGWKTNTTAASQPVDWWVTNAPIQGAANPSTSLVISYSINGGAVTRAVSITPGGIDITGSGGITIGGAAPTAGHVMRSNGTAFVDGQVAVGDLSGLPIPFSQGGNNDTGTGLTTFTPTVNFTGGTGTSSAGSTGAYKQIAAKLYYVQFTLSITYTTIPTSFNVTLPNGFVTAVTGGLFGQNTSTGALVQARSSATSNAAGSIIDSVGNIAITASGQTIILSGVLSNS